MKYKWINDCICQICGEFHLVLEKSENIKGWGMLGIDGAHYIISPCPRHTQEEVDTAERAVKQTGQWPEVLTRNFAGQGTPMGRGEEGN